MPVRGRHVRGVRAMARAQITALMQARACAAIKYFDDARGDAHIHFRADQTVRNRIEEVVDLDVIIQVDPCAPPFRELPVFGG